MAINEFPTWENGTDEDFQAHWESAWEDASDAVTPDASDHGDHPEFETPPPADVEGQEFLAPEAHQMGDPLGSEAPGVPPLEFDLRGTPEPPEAAQEFQSDGPGQSPQSETFRAEPPIPVTPIDLEGFESPTDGEAGDPVGATSEPQGQTPLNWAFPIPPQDHEDAGVQEFAGPQAEDLGDIEEFEPQPPQQYQQQDTMEPAQAPDQPPVDPQDFQTPQPVPIDAMNNEDLFARVGWRVEPPRTANTFWYM